MAPPPRALNLAVALGWRPAQLPCLAFPQQYLSLRLANFPTITLQQSISNQRRREDKPQNKRARAVQSLSSGF
eukprot:1319338-Amphidinium_carterae.1